MPWYLVHTKPRQEFRACENLQRQGYRCMLPVLHAEKVRRGRLQPVEEALFARYLFIELDDESNWMPIRSTLGVQALVRFGGKPARVPQELVASLAEADAARRASPPRTLFTPGETLRITEGPFVGLEAVYQMPDGDSRALVLISWLHRSVALKVELGHLKPAAAD